MRISNSFMSSLFCPPPCIMRSNSSMLATSISETSVQYRSAQKSVMTRILGMPTFALSLAMAKLSAKVGMPRMRVMTDFCAERYWTLVSEMEVASMDEFERMMQGGGQNSEDMKEFEILMK